MLSDIAITDCLALFCLIMSSLLFLIEFQNLLQIIIISRIPSDGPDVADGPDDLRQDLLRQLSEVDQSPITDESMRSTPFPDYQAVLHKRMPGDTYPPRGSKAHLRHPPPKKSPSRSSAGPAPGGSRSNSCDDQGPAQDLERRFTFYRHNASQRTCYYYTSGSYEDACYDFETIMALNKVRGPKPFENKDKGIYGQSIVIVDFKMVVRNGSSHSYAFRGPTSRPTLEFKSLKPGPVQVRKFRYNTPGTERGSRP